MNKKYTCFRNCISYENEKILFNLSKEIIEYFSNTSNYRNPKLSPKDIKWVYRNLLRIALKRKKVIIGRDIDLLIEEYRIKNNIKPKRRKNETL